MTRYRKAIIAGALTVTSAASVAALPVFGPGMPVFDGTAFGEALVHTAKLVATVNQLYQTYQKITQTYNHMMYQAQYITTLSRYNAPTMLWKGLSGTDAYGKTGKWISAVNSGVDAFAGWTQTTTNIAMYPNGFATVPASQRDRRKSEYASIELQDGTAVSAIDTIGRVRGNGPGIEKVVSILQSDSLSTDPDMHTEAAQLNKANAIALVQTKALADQNKLLLTNAELSLIRIRQEREAAAYSLLADVEFRTSGKAALDVQHSGASAAMMTFRLP